MLKAIGLAPPQQISVHGYWNVDDRKVSKSLGNMISPLAMRDRYGFETFRYFLLREMSFGLDANFTEEALVERVNADLANNIGNLVSRTLNLVEKSCGGDDPGGWRRRRRRSRGPRGCGRGANAGGGGDAGSSSRISLWPRSWSSRRP